MKHIIALILSLLLLLHIAGYQLVYVLLVQMVKREVKQNIAKGLTANVPLFVFSGTQLKDVQWKEAGKEFKHKGRLYDVVRTIKSKDSTIVYCIADDDETILMNALQQEDENNATNLYFSAGAKLLLIQYLPASTVQTPHFEINRVLTYNSVIPQLLTPVITVPNPPPKVC